MPYRLLTLAIAVTVAAPIFFGASTLQPVSAQSPPEVPETRMMLGKVLLTDMKQSDENDKSLLSSEGILEDSQNFTRQARGQAIPGAIEEHSLQSDFADQQFTNEGLPVSYEGLPAGCPPPCGPLGGHFGRRLNLLPSLHNYIFNPPERHRGIGEPLTRESWRYRPFGLGAFVGFIHGGTLINDWTGSDSGTLGGFRLSWDPGYYWGCEFRYASTSMGQWDSLTARHALEAAEGTYDPQRDVDLNLWDFSLLWYPWGDTTWRPYALIGLGGAQIRFDDVFWEHWSQQQFSMPLALGLKYRYNSRLAFRFEVSDNITFNSGQINSIHYFSITGGLELRFGGHRKAYWPWSPGKYYW